MNIRLSKIWQCVCRGTSSSDKYPVSADEHLVATHLTNNDNSSSSLPSQEIFAKSESPDKDFVKAMSELDQTRVIVPGVMFFHGCREFSKYTNYHGEGKGLLLGTRKWCSRDVRTALSYAFLETNGCSKQGGARLLWICRAKIEMKCIEGRQELLRPKSPWRETKEKPCTFKTDFPDHFAEYAEAVFKEPGPTAFLAEREEPNSYYNEILITYPEETIEVMKVIEIPTSIQTVEEAKLYFQVWNDIVGSLKIDSSELFHQIK